MTWQPELWNGPDPSVSSQPMVRHDDHDTSNGAAVVALHRKVAVKAAVLEALTLAGPQGLNDFELAALVGVKQTHCGKRRLDLVRDGLVVQVVGEDGKPVTRPSDTGSPSLVWAVAS